MPLNAVAKTPSLSRNNQVDRTDLMIERALQIVFCVLVVHSLWVFSIGWDHTILDQYGFRQAQTAISVDYIAHGGPWLDYETPVLGPPWSIPFEFPLYQWTAALFVTAFHLRVDQACRITSVAFFYLSFCPLNLLLATLGLNKVQRWPFFILMLVSPTYLFWSRAALIESCSVFLGITYLWLSAKYINEPRTTTGVAAICLGCLGAMVKLPTFCGFSLCAGLILLGKGRAGHMRTRSELQRLVIAGIYLLVMPMMVGYGWTRYADAIKLRNLLAGFIVSSALNAFTFGPLKLRFEPQFWSVIWFRGVPDILGGQVTLASVVVVLPLVRAKKIHAVASVFIFIVALLVFANLHYVHKYYQYEIGLFLIGAVSFLIADAISGNRSRWCGLIVLSIAIVTGLHQYYATYYQSQIKDNLALAPTANAIQARTVSGETVIIYGMDWSPELPYYSGRRAIALRNSERPSDIRLRRALAGLGEHRLGAMAVCYGARTDLMDARQRAEAYGLDGTPGYSDGNCAIYFTRSGLGPSSETQVPIPGVVPGRVLASLDSPKQGMTFKGSLGVGGWALADGGIAEVAIYLDGNRTGSADIGLQRPDVQRAYPTLPGALASGFAGRIDLGGASGGAHEVKVRLRLNDGAIRELPAVTVNVARW
jgi:hypothetical protein